MIPPKESGEFVAKMENALETNKMPYNPRFPVVCMDEQPFQLLGDVWEPIPETKNHLKRVDYEYERKGTASIFMFTEPLGGWREVHVRSRRTKRDWSEEIKELLDHDPSAEKVILICDNLNTHTYGSIDDRYPPSLSLSLCRRMEIRYTPKHGSGLNIAECELSVFTAQCLKGRRFSTSPSFSVKPPHGSLTITRHKRD